MENSLAVVIAYFVGSVPFALLVSRRRGVDLRSVGSGNVGAANVLRTSGVGAAVVAMALDGLKGALAVLIAQRLTSGAATPVAAALASIVGHIYPIWLGFRGGKGVATAAGAFAVLTPVAFGAAAVAVLLAVWFTRFISVGSVAGAVTLPVASAVMGAPIAATVGAALASALILHRHRANISRVIAGTERRIGQRLFPPSPTASAFADAPADKSADKHAQGGSSFVR
jgi:glycerol-3-phosphate acyltransferase PlsY